MYMPKVKVEFPWSEVLSPVATFCVIIISNQSPGSFCVRSKEQGRLSSLKPRCRVLGTERKGGGPVHYDGRESHFGRGLKTQAQSSLAFTAFWSHGTCCCFHGAGPWGAVGGSAQSGVSPGPGITCSRECRGRSAFTLSQCICFQYGIWALLSTKNS